MNTELKRGLLSLWETASKIANGLDGESYHSDRLATEAIVWLLPSAEPCAVFSIPMDKVEMYAVRIGNLIVGSAGVHSSSEYLAEVRRQKLVMAPCRLRPVPLSSAPSPALTECLSRSACLQELDLAA